MQRNTTMTQATHAKSPPHFHAIRAAAILASLSLFWYCRGMHVAPKVTELKAFVRGPLTPSEDQAVFPLFFLFGGPFGS
jgi:hypothetical protein